MKTGTVKLMTLITTAVLGTFSAGTVLAAENNDFYTQPPADSDWEKADTEGTYASYTNGSDYVNIYKYSLDDVNIAIAKCNDTYEACYQTVYSEGNSLYMTVGYAKDADDIEEIPPLPDRQMKIQQRILIRWIPILPIREAREIQILPIQK